MNRVGLITSLSYLEVWPNHSIPQRKEAVHATYTQFHRSPTGVSFRLHQSQLRDLSCLDAGLVPVVSSSVHHRAHSSQWLHARWSPQSLSPLLQRRILGSRFPVAQLGTGLDPNVCTC